MVSQVINAPVAVNKPKPTAPAAKKVTKARASPAKQAKQAKQAGANKLSDKPVLVQVPSLQVRGLLDRHPPPPHCRLP